MFCRSALPLIGRRLIAGSIETPNNIAPSLQPVRWRKRRWVPRAASKMYYVRKPTPQDPEETVEMTWRYKNYFTAMRGLRAHFKAELEAKAAASTSLLQSEKEEQEWASLMVENEMWNRETGAIRMLRQEAEEMAAEEKRLQLLISREEEQAALQQKAREKVIMELENAKSFIGASNLETEIEKALNMRVNYNFAIDVEGNRYIETPDGSTLAETKAAEQVGKHNITPTDGTTFE